MRILAHRGASGYAPENTFAAFELGLKMGADAIETDIRMTRDAVLVLHHDEKVDRTTTGTGPLSDLTLSDLQQLDAGIKFHARFAGERVPRTADFLDRFVDRIPLCLEIKLAAVIEPLIDLLQRTNRLRHPNLEFTSFEWDIVDAFHRRLPGIAIGPLTRSFTRETVDQVKNHGLQRICPPAKDVTLELVDYAHSLGLTVRTWGAKTREVLQHILDCRVDGTTLNHPDWICKKNGTPVVVPESTIVQNTAPRADL